MGADTKIEWADHSWNPWVGCQKVSAACDHCYAEGWAKRTGHPELWAGDRRRTAPNNWRQPRKWARAAAGTRPRVFCASLADVFDNKVPGRWRDDLWHLISQTPELDWLLLTKRPQNIAKMLPGPKIGAPEWGAGWPNVWFGTTVENQEEADRRIPALLSVRAHRHFLSCEPLLGHVRLRPEWLGWRCAVGGQVGTEAACHDCDPCLGAIGRDFVNWVIVGGESGAHARPMDADWARDLLRDCGSAGAAFHFKQWGGLRPKSNGRLLDGRTWDELPA